jgi:hypothetical protein
VLPEPLKLCSFQVSKQEASSDATHFFSREWHPGSELHQVPMIFPHQGEQNHRSIVKKLVSDLDIHEFIGCVNEKHHQRLCIVHEVVPFSESKIMNNQNYQNRIIQYMPPRCSMVLEWLPLHLPPIFISNVSKYSLNILQHSPEMRSDPTQDVRVRKL